jgi:hypothetical protein
MIKQILTILILNLLLLSCTKDSALVKVAISKVDIPECYKVKDDPEEQDKKLEFYEMGRMGLLYLNHQAQEYLFIAPDCISPRGAWLDTLRMRIEADLKIPKQHIMFHANHNHQLRRFDIDCFWKHLLQEVQAMKQRAVPAEMAYVRASAEKLLFNRRIFISDELGKLCLYQLFRSYSDLEKGTIDFTAQVKDFFLGAKIDKEYGSKGIVKRKDLKSPHLHAYIKEIEDKGLRFMATGPLDERLEWLVFRNAGGGPVIGSLVRFASHRYRCPQYLTRALSQATAGAPSIFLIGPAGDAGFLRTCDGSPGIEERRMKDMERIASTMAERLIPGLKKERYQPLKKLVWQKRNVGLEMAEEIRQHRGELYTWEDKLTEKFEQVRKTDCTPLEYKLTRDRVGRGWALSWADKFPDTLYLDLTLIKMNDVAVLGLPGEILVDVSETIRSGADEPNLVILELCDEGRTSYVPHPDEFKYGSYEVISAKLSPAGIQHLMDEAVALVKGGQ